MIKKIAIIGSTGSIGTQTLEVIRKYRSEFNVVCLAAFSNAELLERQSKEFKPRYCGLLCGKNASFHCGLDAYEKVLEFEIDILVASSGGIAALPVVHKALERGITVALANKETLVAGGEVINRLPHNKRKNLIPVDSEHSAIFQCLKNEDTKSVRRLILTASGGAFFGKDREFLKIVTAQQALKHPTWSMGKKITVDSATLMNKGFELIEAHWLFGVPEEKIDILIHPQSIVHSLVEFEDSSVLAQLSEPDMQLPIQLALTYPQRKASSVSALDLAGKKLEFYPLKTENSKCVSLCRQALNKGGFYPAALNAANDVCVDAFLQHKIAFLDIENTVEKVLNSFVFGQNELTLDSVFAVSDAVKAFTEKLIEVEKQSCC